MRRWLIGGVVALTATAGLVGSAVPPAGAAGIVTHAWMALDAVDRVRDPALHALLDAHRDQVRAGAEFPDGGYWTRSFGTPGGDYGEEAHWQRFIDAYVDGIRHDASCGDLRDPNGPCAPQIAHAFGAAGHGMGDEVWDWLFEPNGPGFGEDYLPPAWAGFVGPGGLEAQMDVWVIAHDHRPTGPTPDLPDAGRIIDAFTAIGRGDISIDALPVGENMLEVERGVEDAWVADHSAAVERAMPWTTSHVTSSAGGVGFGSVAIAGYYDGLWDRLLGQPQRTRVSAVAPADGSRSVPPSGWTGDYGPGSNVGNSGGLTRIAAALSSALPFNAMAGGPPVSSELPADAFRLRVVATGALVPPRSGYPRIVPYGPEAGEHVVAFQPAGDLSPCTRYRAEITRALLDAAGQPVVPASWTFRTSGCRGGAHAPVRGTVTCATASLLAADASGAGSALARLDGCAGGEDGRAMRGAALPIAAGVAALHFDFARGGCDAFAAGGGATVSGLVQWEDGAGRVVGYSRLSPQAYDLRGTKLTVDGSSRALPNHVLALRLAPEVPACVTSNGVARALSGGGRTTAWPPGG
jgi:hypothetical protein